MINLIIKNLINNVPEEKRRTRAGIGRCQSGFCAPIVMEIISRELGTDPLDLTKSGKNSKLLVGKTKDTL